MLNQLNLNANDDWKQVTNYNDYYINKDGTIISFKRKSIHKLKTSIDRNGYVRIHLLKNGIRKSYLLHRLVAQTFIPNPNNLPEINHKDENKQNNCVNNLEWCSHKYNSNYGTRVARIIPKTIAKTRVKICQCDENMNVIKIWDGVNVASKELGITQQNITNVCQKKRKHAGGYRWCYYKEVV